MLETERLLLARLSADHDADFMLELLNEPSFVRFVGDKGVRSAADARRYILEGPMASYERFGFGLYRAELKGSRDPIGICGLLKRDWLDAADVGFALLPRYWSRGYAKEAASAVMSGAREAGVARLAAITTPDNHASIRVLARLGFRFERTARPPGEDSDLSVFVADA